MVIFLTVKLYEIFLNYGNKRLEGKSHVKLKYFHGIEKSCEKNVIKYSYCLFMTNNKLRKVN